MTAVVLPGPLRLTSSAISSLTGSLNGRLDSIAAAVEVLKPLNLNRQLDWLVGKAA